MVWSTAQSALYKAVDRFNTSSLGNENSCNNTPEKSIENCSKNSPNFAENYCENSGKNCRENSPNFAENFCENSRDNCRENAPNFAENFCENLRENCSKSSSNFVGNYCENSGENCANFAENFCENSGEKASENCKKSEKSSDFAEKIGCKRLQNDPKFTAKDCKNGNFANFLSQPFADKDFILLAGLIFILMNENADKKLILALVFVLLG